MKRYNGQYFFDQDGDFNFSLFVNHPGWRWVEAKDNKEFHRFCIDIQFSRIRKVQVAQDKIEGFAWCWLLGTGYWLLVTGYWLLVTGYWLP